jgi:hypothetical protein
MGLQKRRYNQKEVSLGLKRPFYKHYKVPRFSIPLNCDGIEALHVSIDNFG